MRKRTTKRALALVMTLALLVGTLPTAAFAAGEGPPCESHPAHTAECGYAANLEGQPCKHELGQHDEACGYAEGTAETPCGHTEHDGACGYVEEAAGSPCGHSCERCALQDSGPALPGDPTPAGANSGILYDGLTVTTVDGEKASQDGDKQVLLGNGTYTISGTWNGTLENVNRNTPKAVILVQSGKTAEITLDRVTIDVDTVNYACAFNMTGANVTLTLDGENTLKSGERCAGLETSDGAVLNIQGSGSLTATGGELGAGIGGGYGGNGGSITITGGQIKATGNGGAGIGCGDESDSAGTITISGSAWVTAASIKGGAGIGGGNESESGGTIIISGNSRVTATGGSGGAGIGCGRYTLIGGTITIFGNARVTATGGAGGGAGIGSGYTHDSDNGNSGDIAIQDNSIVFANGKDGGSHIGAGINGSNGTIARNGGVIFEDKTGTVYGAVTLPDDLTMPDNSTLSVPSDSTLTIPDGSTLTIPDGSTLTIPDGSTLTILDGSTLTISNGATLTNKGIIQNDGTLTNNGTLDNLNGTIMGIGQYNGGGTIIKATRTITLPDAAQVGTTSVNLQPAAPSTGAWDGTVEYGLAASNNNSAVGKWQTDRTFNGLSENTTYHFFARVTGGTYYANAVSGGVAITTGKNVYTVTVNGGTASPASASAEDAVTITATVPSGQRFTGWTGLDGLTTTEGSAATEKVIFTMPDRAVEVTASFENIPTGGGSGPSYYTRTLTDKASGVKVTGRSIHESARLTVTVGTLHSAGDAGCDLLRAVQEAGHLLGAWDVSLSRGFRGNVTVSLPVEGRNGDTLTVAHCMDGKLTLSNVKVSGGFAAVETDGLSPFAVLDGAYTLAELEALAKPGWANPFVDVTETDWFYEAVEYVHSAGLMVGTTDTTFSPSGAVTRAQVWTVLARMDGQDMAGGDPWYAPARDWAVANGVSDGTDPDGAVTREQLVTMLWRYAQSADMDVSVGEDTNILSYDDALDVAEWAIPAFQWACGAGVVSGTSETTLSPQAGATRAQLAAILQRFSSGTV